MSVNRSAKEQSIITHAERELDPHQIRDLWTQHKIVLIAYEAQFMYARREATEGKCSPSTAEKEGPGCSIREEMRKKRSNNRASKMQNEASFIFLDKNEESEVDARKEVAKQVDRWPNIAFLLGGKHDELDDLAKMMEIMIEIKHSAIVTEFMDLYEKIAEEVVNISFTFEEEFSRREWQSKIVQRLVDMIENCTKMKNSEFPYFSAYLASDKISFKKLLTVTAYCFLAERFNFSINEYYCDAFSYYDEEGSPDKRPRVQNGHKS